MSTEIYCPDCGGLISNLDDPAIKRCSCMAASGGSDSSLMGSDLAPLPGNVSSNRAPGSNGPSSSSSSSSSNSAPAPVKVCCACGKDLAGKKRIKDSRGLYWCPACSDADNKKKSPARNGKGEICPDCGRSFPDSKMLDFQLTRVCVTCYKERAKQGEKEQKKDYARKVHNAHERRTLLKLCIVAVVLILITTARQLGWF